MLDLVIFAPVCVDVDDNDGDAGSGKLDYAKNVLLPDRVYACVIATRGTGYKDSCTRNTFLILSFLLRIFLHTAKKDLKKKKIFLFLHDLQCPQKWKDIFS